MPKSTLGTVCGAFRTHRISGFEIWWTTTMSPKLRHHVSGLSQIAKDVSMAIQVYYDKVSCRLRTKERIFFHESTVEPRLAHFQAILSQKDCLGRLHRCTTIASVSWRCRNWQKILYLLWRYHLREDSQVKGREFKSWCRDDQIEDFMHLNSY